MMKIKESNDMIFRSIPATPIWDWKIEDNLEQRNKKAFSDTKTSGWRQFKMVV
jgi:hypothetical protein